MELVLHGCQWCGVLILAFMSFCDYNILFPCGIHHSDSKDDSTFQGHPTTKKKIGKDLECSFLLCDIVLWPLKGIIV